MRTSIRFGGNTQGMFAVKWASAMVLSGACASAAAAADSTWLGSGGSAWEVAAHWEGSVVPGNNSGAAGTSADRAFFTGLPPQTVIAVDANRNIGTLQFGSISLPDTTTIGFTIGSGTYNAGNALYLSNGGALHMLSTVVPTHATNVGHQVAVHAPMVLTGTSYSFISDAGSTTETRPGFALFGSITAAAGAPTTISFNTVGGNRGSSRNEVQSQITDGPNGAVVSIIKDGPGCWEFNQSDTNANTYSGNTILNGGVLRTATASGFNGLGGFSPNSHYFVNAGAELRNSVAGSTVRAVTINPGGSMSVSTSSSTTLNFASNSGPSLHFNFGAGQSGAFAVNGPFNLRGNTAMQGGVKLTAGPTTGTITIGATTSVFDLGTVMRVFEIGKGDPLNAFDLRLTGTVVGGGSGAGIVKTGPGTLRFDASTSTWTGILEIQEGEVRGSVDNAFGGQPELRITGGNLHVLGTAGTNTQTFGPMTATKGSITAGSTLASTIRSPSFALNVGAGDNFSAAAILADSGGAAALVKTGAGVATLTGANTYTGGTTVSGGVLSVNTNSEDVILNPGSAGANITSGKLVFDYTGGTSPALQILPILTSGFAVNFASGQIRSTAANASLGLGYADDAVGNFAVALTRYGDANIDLITNIGDFSLLAANFNQPGGWDKGNFNYDALIDIGDFSLLAANFNAVAPLDSARGTVPEPAGVVIVVLAAGVLRRTRRDGVRRAV